MVVNVGHITSQVVLLAHGAALATAVWSRPNTTWVEMTPYLNGSSLASLLARQDLHQGRDHLQILAHALGPTSGVGLRHVAVPAPEAHTVHASSYLHAFKMRSSAVGCVCVAQARFSHITTVEATRPLFAPR